MADPVGIPASFWPLDYVDRLEMRVPVPLDEDSPWRSDLMDAIKRSDVERVGRLLADPDGTLDFVHPGARSSPLQLAVSEQGEIDLRTPPSKDPTIVRLLLDAGAAADFTPTSTRSPFDRAQRWPEVQQLLFETIGR